MPEPKAAKARLGGLERKASIGLPGLTEPETMRHYVRLSQRNYAIDAGLYPLGSCTMKHNAAPQREDGAAAGLRRHPSAAAAEDGAGRHRADGGAVGLPAGAHRHEGADAVAQGRRPRRACRHALHQGRARGQGLQAQRRARARLRARHQPGHRRLHGLHREVDPGARRWHGRGRRRARPRSAPTSPPSC